MTETNDEFYNKEFPFETKEQRQLRQAAEDEEKARTRAFNDFMRTRYERMLTDTISKTKSALERADDEPSRVFIFSSEPSSGTEEEQDAFEKMAEETKEIAKLAKKQGAKEPVETVDTFSFTAAPAEMVNHPNHYNDTPIETFEMFLLNFHDRPDMIKGALLFNIFKYRDRASKKNGEEDIKKMQWYLNQFEMHFPEDYSMYEHYHSFKESK